MKAIKSADRRKVLTTFRSIGLALMGGIVWSAYVSENAYASLILRPPGAKEENDFLKNCIKCGLCVEACPYDTLKLASPGSKMPMGTPYFIPRKTPCYMCVDIPCVPICPTDALDEKVLLTNNKLDIAKARMGVAVVDIESCVAYWGIQCDACYRACPLIDKALVLEYKRNERTGKHSYLLPVVVADVCTGCGLCEHACITQKAAIYVLPREVGLGQVGTNYVKGWDATDENRLNNLDEAKNKKTSNKSVENYLNSEEF